MGSGRSVGRQLKAWLHSQAFDVRAGSALVNRLLDALGDDEALRGPLRDLASQPLFRKLLLENGSGQRATLDELNKRLAATYTPAVLQELQALLEEATGLPLLPSEAPPATTTVRVTADVDVDAGVGVGIGASPSPNQPKARDQSDATARAARFRAGENGERLASSLIALLRDLRGISPGIALAAGSTLVLWWAAGRLEDVLPGEPQGGGGLLLVLALLLLQALAIGPLRGIQRQWPLDSGSAFDPSRAWRWVLAPWIHQRNGEGLALAAALLLLLSSSPAGLPLLALRPLDLPAVALGYGLIALITTIPAVLVARHYQIQKRWSGAAGVVAALASLAALEGLIHRQVVHLGAAPVLMPAWVLLLLIGALALQLELPPQARETSRPWQRLLASTWCWGSLLGLGTGLIDALGALLRSLASLVNR